MIKRCKECGQSNNRVTIYPESGLCMNCHTDWKLRQDMINTENFIKKSIKEKDFYKE
jgi:recombinational DNA repair protein (RecF pathway)